MKAFEVLLQYLGQYGHRFFQSHSREFTQEMLARGRKIAILLCVAALAIVVFAFGFAHAFEAWLVKMEATSELNLGRLEISLILMGLAALTLLFALSKKNWSLQPENKKNTNESALENAATLLMLEIAKEIRERRKSSTANKQNESSENETQAG